MAIKRVNHGHGNKAEGREIGVIANQISTAMKDKEIPLHNPGHQQQCLNHMAVRSLSIVSLLFCSFVVVFPGWDLVPF